jgi:hypothetical protein
MAKPRWATFREWEPLIVHSVSRCVRQQPILEAPARREWIERRLESLAQAFAIDVLEWAAMSNHLHLGLRTHPHLAMAWSREEVAKRWLTICPNWTVKRVLGLENLEPNGREIALAASDPSLVSEWRRRLYDLSWFHKLLKEPCARLWNQEDDVAGCLWQERYFCLPCRSSDQLKATAAYIALNPVRAGVADELDRCRFSSILRRLRELEDELRRGLHSGDREAHERILLAPAIPCRRGDEVAHISDAEFCRRIEVVIDDLTRRDHAISHAHQAKLDAERFERPAPAEGPAAEEEAARARRLFRTRAMPRPRMPERHGNARPPGRTNPWRDAAKLPMLEGLTLAAFINYVDATGRAPPPGKAGIGPDAPRAIEKLVAQVEAERWPRDGPSRPW